MMVQRLNKQLNGEGDVDKRQEWFQKAMKDPNCEEASYFYFRTTENDKEPNNWRSNFGGSVRCV